MKHFYSELELTRRCNSRCEHCMRGDAQAKDLSDDSIDSYFSKVTDIFTLTLTGGEVSLVPKKIIKITDAIKEHGTRVTHVGILTNGLYIRQPFIDAIKALKEVIGSFAIEFSCDPFHRKVDAANIALVKEGLGQSVKFRTNPYILASGRASRLKVVNAVNYPWKYWFLNGWVMEPVYLNANGDLVGTDTSYADQESYIISKVSDMSYQKLLEFKGSSYCIYGRYNPTIINQVSQLGPDGETLLPPQEDIDAIKKGELSHIQMI